MKSSKDILPKGQAKNTSLRRAGMRSLKTKFVSQLRSRLKNAYITSVDIDKVDDPPWVASQRSFFKESVKKWRLQGKGEKTTIVREYLDSASAPTHKNTLLPRSSSAPTKMNMSLHSNIRKSSYDIDKKNTLKKLRNPCPPAGPVPDYVKKRTLEKEKVNADLDTSETFPAISSNKYVSRPSQMADVRRSVLAAKAKARVENNRNKKKTRSSIVLSKIKNIALNKILDPSSILEQSKKSKTTSSSNLLEDINKSKRNIRNIVFATHVDDENLSLGILPAYFKEKKNKSKILTTQINRSDSSSSKNETESSNNSILPIYSMIKVIPDRLLSISLSDRNNCLTRVHLIEQTQYTKGLRRVSVVRALKKSRKQSDEWEKIYDIDSKTWYWQNKLSGETQWLTEDELPYPRRRRRALQRAMEQSISQQKGNKSISKDSLYNTETISKDSLYNTETIDYYDEYSNDISSSSKDIWEQVNDWEYNKERDNCNSRTMAWPINTSSSAIAKAHVSAIAKGHRPAAKAHASAIAKGHRPASHASIYNPKKTATGYKSHESHQSRSRTPWSRHFDHSKSAWYWYNSTTNESQWE